MITSKSLITLLLLGLCHVSLAAAEAKQKSERATYIVHMDKSEMPTSFEHHTHWYDSSLKSVSDSARIIYTYNNAIHGFSTRLSPQEADSLAAQPGILSVLPELRYELHTTRTPEFLGLGQNADLIPESDSASDVVIGVLDTGAWPESKSFDDSGLGPVPDSWKGACETGTNFTSSSCNKKLIGARYFYNGYEATLGPIDTSKESKSPRDDDGHGTHTSTTAAGSVVERASLFDYAEGNARGMATRARVAAYKVCWIGGCFSTDILAAIDKAIEDGVNVMSMSLGGGTSDFYRDSVAIGAFAAMEKGILISCSAGNAGPSSYSLSNVAPWITTVGAGTLDRDFPAYASIGNGQNYSGVSLYRGSELPGKLLPLIYAANASNSTNGNLCMMGTLTPDKVRGKIVLCDRGVNPRVQKGAVVKAAGGAGMVLSNTAANGEELVADAHLLPATSVGQNSGDAIKKYISTESDPTVTILFEGTKVGVKPSPVVAAFSSRGPNSITPNILKPDLIAPGVNILAGWSGAVGPTGLATDPRRVEFNIISGTSMSCPHVSGLAALLKGAHPDWSPAAIRSALMTTAYVQYKDGQNLLDIATGKESTPFDHGAGHVDPVKALNPGLVYDLTADDYLSFLCALNYTAQQINSVARRKFDCDASKKYSVNDLNYPSFAVNIETSRIGSGSGGFTVVKHTRTLTNVAAKGDYMVSITTMSPAVKISVEPQMLSFSEVNEKKSYTVTFTVSSMPSDENSFGRLEWSDGKHIVASPIAISWS
ncbi:Peptidase_S8 domain-containing protein/PA domain-containing protein/Inhibitor_I9 domain-containing protein [Cephalotus follicularis]|uniref:Peptidase_S8 domain-containing protein/PA domain-containing protein/Inhibitor_I9 domain-containing protein n=1 Tax=Cephalotus follicularis TaxID=3775 RepID=A0A1Q3ASM9_CEPFO|nr:Peptidase_S8 domain-containing protein/PA domain-containing protein/Inhibitor_I9 domain-containing protein [Cephalotus follicularis]